jgi:hypothetical protein
MTPTITHYGLPLLVRHYPKRIEDFAYDLFFGRPVLIVQHNADFADGWGGILSFINQLNALEPNLQWLPLGQVAKKMRLTEQEAGHVCYGDVSNTFYSYTINTYVKTALRRYCCVIRDIIVHRSRFLRAFTTR